MIPVLRSDVQSRSDPTANYADHIDPDDRGLVRSYHRALDGRPHVLIEDIERAEADAVWTAAQREVRA